MRLSHLPLLLLSLCPDAFAFGGSSSKKSSNAILLSQVRALTLRAGHDTTHRRVSPLPQLKCVGGNAQGLYEVDVMRCKNSGSEYDAEDISWTCQASLPPEFKLGSTDVICEGYDSAEDPFVLKGSCAVEYRLVLTPMGEEKYKSRTQGAWRTQKNKGSQESEGGLGDAVAGFLFWVIFAGIAGMIIYSVCIGPNAARRPGGGFGNRNNLGGWGGGGGGGGDDGSDDPPPPYTPRGTKPKSTRSSPRNASSSANSGPGFWTGAATGAAAGYGAAAWNASRQNRAAAQQQRAEPSSWFGGGGNRGQDYGMAGPSNYASAPAPSSSRHESTGFGGTTRR